MKWFSLFLTALTLIALIFCPAARAGSIGELIEKTAVVCAEMYRAFANPSVAAGATGASSQPVYPSSTTATAPATYQPSNIDGSGMLTDGRDGKKYKTVVIGGKRWMGENLNYATAGDSWCYDNNSYNCNKYGRLYDWNTAMKSCPTGWHLPSQGEWDNLAQAVGGKKERYDDGKGLAFDYWDGAGKKLKSKTGWNKNDDGSSGNGTDNYGFSALPGGYRDCSDGSFVNAGYNGRWWTATEYGSDYAYGRSMDYYDDYLYDSSNDKDLGFSVRCVGD